MIRSYNTFRPYVLDLLLALALVKSANIRRHVAGVLCHIFGLYLGGSHDANILEMNGDIQAESPGFQVARRIKKATLGCHKTFMGALLKYRG